MAFGPRHLLNVRRICAAVVLLALAFSAWWFRGHVFSAFGWLAEAVGGRTLAVLCIALGLGLLVCVFSWLIFPIIVYLGLRDLRRRTAELERAAQVCVQSLSQTAPARDAPEPDPDTGARIQENG